MSLLRLDLCDSKLQIIANMYTTTTHLGEYSTSFISMEIIVCNCAFFENHQSILHALPSLVVKTICVMQVCLLFSKLVSPTSDSNMVFLYFAHTPFHFNECFIFFL
jgi:hypothetical protein